MNWTAESKIIVQGITESLARDYAPRMKAYGTNIVAGITAGQGEQQLEEIPIFNLVEEAVSQQGEIQTSLIFSPPFQVLDAALEAIAGGIREIIITSAGVPPLDLVRLLRKAETTNTLILGPGNAGIIIPEKIWLGISEPQFYHPGKIGLISRSPAVSYEIALELNRVGLGESMAVNLGTDSIIGSNFQQWLKILEEDQKTEAIVLLGQATGNLEQAAAAYIASSCSKPIIVYLTGIEASVEKIFADATTIISNHLSSSLAANSLEKKVISAFKKAGVTIAKKPEEIAKLLS